jgi:hypothetical protein
MQRTPLTLSVARALGISLPSRMDPHLLENEAETRVQGVLRSLDNTNA